MKKIAIVVIVAEMFFCATAHALEFGKIVARGGVEGSNATEVILTYGACSDQNQDGTREPLNCTFGAATDADMNGVYEPLDVPFGIQFEDDSYVTNITDATSVSNSSTVLSSKGVQDLVAGQTKRISALEGQTNVWNYLTNVIAGANISVVFTNGNCYISSSGGGGGGGINPVSTNVGSLVYYTGSDWAAWTNGYITNDNLFIESWGAVYMGATDCRIEPYRPGGTNRMRFVEAGSNYYYWTTP